MAKKHIYNVEVIFKGKRSACAIGTKKIWILNEWRKNGHFRIQKRGLHYHGRTKFYLY